MVPTVEVKAVRFHGVLGEDTLDKIDHREGGGRGDSHHILIDLGIISSMIPSSQPPGNRLHASHQATGCKPATTLQASSQPPDYRLQASNQATGLKPPIRLQASRSHKDTGFKPATKLHPTIFKPAIRLQASSQPPSYTFQASHHARGFKPATRLQASSQQ